ncbi:outer membrane immunogenic protein [Sphingomonas naasensis]|uniref:Porin family protein n=1 Tax=Sphingomonas naasensis TaxID=1344951 RepID=A0A4S1WKQ2_9SPHN|nr:outer membrane beta-barrel protein [Sphingomonas naasensis]NIJ21855.1 outer membrane immunogenic protein [Sphingomonas naasensis]TGX42447.1 porin family protein [Sphingomonas naasensis]
MRTLTLITLAASAAASPAFAQDAPFNGPRVEIIAGWDHSNLPTADMSDGLTYGGAIGYDVQRGNTVFGVESEITGSTIDRGHQITPDTSIRGAIGRDLYVGGRVGVAVAPNTLIYAKGGYTNVRSYLDYHSPTFNQDGSGIQGGYRVGAGAEVKLTEKTYIRSEYRYSDYGGNDRHQVVGGVGIRF